MGLEAKFGGNQTVISRDPRHFRTVDGVGDAILARKRFKFLAIIILLRCGMGSIDDWRFSITMSSTPSAARINRASRLPKQIYLPRVLGMCLGSLCIGAALWDQTRPDWVWMVLLFGGLIWPHLAYLYSSRAKRPGRAEKSNLMADAALTSFAMYAIGFGIVPSVIGITLTVMNNLAVGGARLWVKGCVATGVGLGVGALFLPWEFHPISSLMVQAASLSLAASYLFAFGWTMWCMARHLEKSREALHTLSQTDGLSGLKNRGAFESALGKKFAELQAMGGHARAALVLIDMDHFKRINDESGHAAGDAVVRTIGLALKFATRQEDTAARYGGDEFAVLLDRADEPDALAFLARMKERIQVMAQSDTSAPALSWSTGIALFDPSLPSTDAWVAQADAALYQVKKRGRGGVVVVEK